MDSSDDSDDDRVCDFFSMYHLDNITFYTVDSLPIQFSLAKLCCAKVIQHEKYYTHQDLPISLYPILMMEAIRKNYRDYAAMLMANWPFKIIVMMDVVFDARAIHTELFSKDYFKNLRLRASSALELFLRLCFTSLRNRLTPHLRVFDLRGAMLNDELLSVLIDSIIAFSNEVLLSDDYHILLECEISNPKTLEELATNFLDTSRKSPRIKIHLHFTKIDSRDIRSEAETWKLLTQINPLELIGLYICCFSNTFLTSVLARFPSLISFGMTNENTFLSGQIPLHLLPRLRRLGLWIDPDKISTCCVPAMVPASVLSELECLDFGFRVNEHFIEKDLRHLISIPLRLRELNLSMHCILAAHLHLLEKLFLSLAPTLTVLFLSDCGIDDTTFGPVIDCILPLVNLVALNMITDIVVNIKVMKEHVPKLASMPRLREIALSAPEEVIDGVEHDAEMTSDVWYETIEKRASENFLPMKIRWTI